jgi:hypothetical protein
MRQMRKFRLTMIAKIGSPLIKMTFQVKGNRRTHMKCSFITVSFIPMDLEPLKISL